MKNKFDKKSVAVFIPPGSGLSSLFVNICSFVEDSIASECFDDLVSNLSSSYEKKYRFRDPENIKSLFAKVDDKSSGVFKESGEKIGSYDSLPFRDSLHMSLWVKSIFINKDMVTIQFYVHQVVVNTPKEDESQSKLLLDLGKNMSMMKI